MSKITDPNEYTDMTMQLAAIVKFNKKEIELKNNTRKFDYVPIIVDDFKNIYPTTSIQNTSRTIKMNLNNPLHHEECVECFFRCHLVHVGDGHNTDCHWLTVCAETTNENQLWKIIPIELLEIIISMLDTHALIELMHTSFLLRELSMERLKIVEKCVSSVCHIHTCQVPYLDGSVCGNKSTKVSSTIKQLGYNNSFLSWYLNNEYNYKYEISKHEFPKKIHGIVSNNNYFNIFDKTERKGGICDDHVCSYVDCNHQKCKYSAYCKWHNEISELFDAIHIL